MSSKNISRLPGAPLLNPIHAHTRQEGLTPRNLANIMRPRKRGWARPLNRMNQHPSQHKFRAYATRPFINEDKLEGKALATLRYNDKHNPGQ